MAQQKQGTITRASEIASSSTTRRNPNKDLKIIIGSSNAEFATLFCNKLKVKPLDIVLRKFANNETYVELKESIRGEDVYIIQSGCGEINDNLMELLMIVDVCVKSSAGRIHTIIPCFPYVRQDTKHGKRMSIVAKLVANMLTASGTGHVFTLDLHASQVEGFFDIPVDNLRSECLIMEWIQKNFPKYEEEIVVVAFDTNAKTATLIAEELRVNFAVAHVDKETKEIDEEGVFPNNITVVGHVKDKTVLFLKNIVDNGAVVCSVSQKLMTLGCNDIILAVSHGMFTNGALQALQNSSYKKVLVTNSIPQEANKEVCPKIEILDVSVLFAEAVKRGHKHEG